MENEEIENKVKGKRKSRVITAADTGSVLTYDKDGALLNDLVGHTHLWDAMKREYKRCARCRKFFLLDSFPKSTSKNSHDGHGALCTECQQIKIDNLTKPPKENNDVVLGGKDDVWEMLNRVSKKSSVSNVPDMVLLDELRRRGYRGKLTMEVEL